MRCEIPEFARCCFCFPLRFGLLAWAYTKLICSLLLLLNVLGYIITEYQRGIVHFEFTLISFICAHILSIIIIIDVAFLIIFIIAAHTKELRKMKLFYIESICALVFYIIAFFLIIGFAWYTLSYFALLFIAIVWAFSFWIIIMQAYITILVKSEILKLERNINFQFVNHTAEDETVKVDLNEIDA